MGLSQVIGDLRIRLRTEGTQKSANDFDRLSAMAKKFDLSVGKLDTEMRKAGLTFSKTGKIVQNDYGKSLSKANATQQLLIRNTRRFRAEMLSLLFVGMAIAGMFNNYVTEGTNMLGLNELLKDSLGLAVAEFEEATGFDKFIDSLAELADKFPVATGAILVGGFAFGKLLETLAMLSLIDMAAIAKNIKGIWTALGGAGGIATILTKVTIIAGAFFMIWSGVKDLLDPLSDGFDKFGGILKIISGIALIIFAIFGGWIPLVIGIGAAFLGWLIQLEPVKDFFIWLWGVIKDIAKAIGNFGIGVLNKLGFDLKPFAAGGIVTRPTAALVGEAGPEAIIPLNQLGNFSPNVTVNANVARNIDITRLANSLAGVYSDQLRSQGINRRVL